MAKMLSTNNNAVNIDDKDFI